jgi:hypothetical protein
MTVRRLGVLQWVGLLAGGAVWWAQHLVGLGVTAAECDPGGVGRGIDNDVWQGALLAVGVLLVLAAGAAAATVLVRTRGTSYEDPPAPGRIRFLAIAAVVANGLFLVIILLDGIASIAVATCRQA